MKLRILSPQDRNHVGLSEMTQQLDEGHVPRLLLKRIQKYVQNAIWIEVEVPYHRENLCHSRRSFRQVTGEIGEKCDQSRKSLCFFSKKIVFLLSIHQPGVDFDERFLQHRFVLGQVRTNQKIQLQRLIQQKSINHQRRSQFFHKLTKGCPSLRSFGQLK